MSSCRVAPPALPYFELSCHLNTSSEVYVLVESEQGFYSTNRHITIPNHSSLDPVYLPRLQNPTSSFTARAKREQDKHFVRMLIHHPMRYAPPDTGAGSHFIQKVICKYRSETIFTAAWGPFVATHPYLAMRLLNALPDEPVQLTWVDNRGNRDQTEVVLP